MSSRKTSLFVLVLTAGLFVSARAAQAQAPGCAVWSRAENRCLEQAPAAPARGVQPLTAATFAEATAVQSREHGDTLSPFTIAFMRRPYDYTVSEKLKDVPFFVMISTPFARAASIAEEARRTFQAPVFPSLDALNANGVVLRVTGSSSLLTADAIQNVVVKHGDIVTKPRRAEVVPTVMQNALGAKKDSAQGDFVFDFSVFDPQYGPLTLVLIGQRGNFEWVMTAEDLAQLK